MFNIIEMKSQPVNSFQPRFEAWLRHVAKDDAKSYDYLAFIQDRKREYSAIDGKVTPTLCIINHDDFTAFIDSYCAENSNCKVPITTKTLAWAKQHDWGFDAYLQDGKICGLRNEYTLNGVFHKGEPLSFDSRSDLRGWAGY